MPERINYLWRLSVTCICFVVFAAGGPLLTTLVLLPIRVLPGSREQRRRRTQSVIRWFFASLVSVLRLTGVMRLQVNNRRALAHCGGQLVFPNHPSYLDVVVLLALIPDACCVVNARLWRSPFYGGIVRAAGYIRNDDSVEFLEHCAETLSNGSPLIIFPEGTRSVPGEPLLMLRGPAHVAIRSGVDIVPVVIVCDPPTLTKNDPWYRIPPRRFSYTLRVGASIRAADCLGTGLPAGIAARRLTRHLETHFNEELNRYARTGARHQEADHRSLAA